jgi:hypothetical protein
VGKKGGAIREVKVNETKRFVRMQQQASSSKLLRLVTATSSAGMFNV